MMLFIHSPLTLALLCLFLPVSTYAGAWTQSEDTLYFSDTSTIYTSESFYDLDGKRQLQPNFYKLEQNFYAEYGLTNDFTIGANLFFHYLNQQTLTTIDTSPTTSVTYKGYAGNIGFGDPELFARYRLWQDDFNVLSIQPLIKLPSYYAYDHLPKGGSSDYDAELSLLAGHSFFFNNQWHYIDARLGYRHRMHEQLHDQIKADIKLGLNLDDNWQIVPAAYFTWSDNLPQRAIFTQSGQNDYDLLKLECSLIYQLRQNMDLHTSIFGHVDGKNTGRGVGISIGTGLIF